MDLEVISDNRAFIINPISKLEKILEEDEEVEHLLRQQEQQEILQLQQQTNPKLIAFANSRSISYTDDRSSSVYSNYSSEMINQQLLISPRVNFLHQKFYLQSRQLCRLDKDLFGIDLYKVSVLQLDDNLLGEIPELIGQMTMLEMLCMQRNYLVNIPSWLADKLTNLRRLDLSDNSISELPENLSGLFQLETLELNKNILKSVPPSHLPPNLVTLELSYNQIECIELPSFESLFTLKLSNNRLRTLGNLPYHLSVVSIDNNYLDSLDHKVVVRNRDLTMSFERSFRDVATERIYKCWYTGSTTLDLSGLGVRQLPSILGSLTHLTSLDLSGNLLSFLPPELERLTNLVTLDLSYNIISILPLYLINYKYLVNLILNGTIDYLQNPPKRIAEGGLLEIKRYFEDLFLGDPSYRVKLMLVGQENVGKTSLVKCMKLKKKVNKPSEHLGNNMSTDGIDIDEIKIVLDINNNSNNNTNNTINNNQNNQENSRSNHSIGNNGSSNNILGETGSSSSIIGRNSNSGPTIDQSGNASSVTSGGSNNNTGSGVQPSPNGNNQQTQQQQQQHHHPHNQKVTLSIWDCAGQELYYTTHQMFLTDKALYTVVWDLCKPEVNSKVEFWLHSIRMKAEDAPIILVGTHLDEFLQTHSEEELDQILNNIYMKYYRKFKLKGITVLSCTTLVGIDNFQHLLKKTIQELPFIKQQIPDLYLKLEKLVIKKRTSLSSPVLSWKNYTQMVLSSLDFHDEIHVKVATKALSSLGCIAYFDDNQFGQNNSQHMDNYVFLDPQWLTDVFSSIITTKHKFIKDGILKKSDLLQIWKAPDFLEDESFQTLLINLLERFELMFPLEGELPIMEYVSSPYLNGKQQQESSNGINHKLSQSDMKKVLSPLLISSQQLQLQNQQSTQQRKSTIDQLSAHSVPTTPASFRQRSNSIDYASTGSLNKLPSGMMDTFINGVAVGGSVSGMTSPLPPKGIIHQNSFTGNGGNGNSGGSGQQTSGSDYSKRFIIPSQLPDKRPSFDLLWPPHDQFRVEYNRWFQMVFIPIGLFSRLLIRLIISKEYSMKPILYWRNGLVLEASSPLGPAATSLIEVSPSTMTIKVSVRSDMRTGKGMAAKLLRLIVEIIEALSSSWYSLEASQLIPCPHCILKASVQQTLFTLTECESAASNGNWYLMCGPRRISLESFVPDVALVDFWGSGSKKLRYDQIRLEKEKRTIRFILPSSFHINNDSSQIQSILLTKAGTMPNAHSFVDLPIITEKLEIAEHNDLRVKFEHKSQSLVVSGTIRKGDLQIDQSANIPKLIGRGASGKIYSAELNGIAVAVKQLEVIGEDAPRIFSEFRKEIHVMSDLKHKNVVNLIGFTTQPFTMVMEYVDGGDLYKFLHSSAGDILNDNWTHRIALALDIAKGMNFLHSVSPPLLHRDLKSPNILLTKRDGRLRAKVGDFGLSSRMIIQALRHKLRNFPVGNITWVAPEILREEEYTVKSDVYAFGLIMHEIMTRQHPYREYNYTMVSMLEEEIKNGLRPSIPSQYFHSVVGQDYCSLLRDCWDGQVERRPTFTKICKRLVQMLQRENVTLTVSPSNQSPRNPAVASSPLSLAIGSPMAGSNHQPSISPLIIGAGIVSPPLLSHPQQTIQNLKNNIEESLPIGGQLQMSLRTHPTDLKITSLLWENRRVWGATSSGSMMIWNAENGKKILYETNLHRGAIHSLILVDEEHIWTGGEDGFIKIWNAWRLNCDDSLAQFKSEYINKKARGTSTLRRKTWAQRWFVLDRKNKTLSYYKKQSDKSPKCTVMLNGAIIEEPSPLAPLKVTLHITEPETRKLDLEFKSLTERDQWLLAISRVINQNVPLDRIDLNEIDFIHGGLQTSCSSTSANVPILTPIPSRKLTTPLVSAMISIQKSVLETQIWVALRNYPVILIFDMASRDLIEVIKVAESGADWKGTDKMILHHNYIWATHDNMVCHIDPRTYQVLGTHTEHTQTILSISSVDRQVWITCIDSTVSVWDETGAVIKRLELSSPITKILQFGSYAWACSFGTIYIYDPITFTIKKQVECKHHLNSVCDLIRVFQQTVWSTCGSNNICIWS